MSCMTRWRLAEEHSSTFITMYSFPCVPCTLYLIYFTSFFLCRVAWRFVATPPVARLCWRLASVSRYSQTSQWLDNRCMSVLSMYRLLPSTSKCIGLAIIVEMLKHCCFFSHFVVGILVPRGKSSAIFLKCRDVTLFLSMLYWKDCPVMVTTVVVTTIAVRYKSTADL